MTTPICFIDTETTSLRPDRRAWDIAMIRRDGTTDIETQFYVSLVDLDLEDADPFSLDVGRFWDRHPHAESVRDGGAIPYNVWSLDREGCAWGVPEGAVVSAPDAAAIVAAWTHRAHPAALAVMYALTAGMFLAAADAVIEAVTIPPAVNLAASVAVAAVLAGSGVVWAWMPVAAGLGVATHIVGDRVRSGLAESVVCVASVVALTTLPFSGTIAAQLEGILA